MKLNLGKDKTGRVVGNEELKGGTVEPDLAIDRHLRMQSYLGILVYVPSSTITTK
jgi:hypothetical protein